MLGDDVPWCKGRSARGDGVSESRGGVPVPQGVEARHQARDNHLVVQRGVEQWS
jgi:hypothetical protein